jgi:HD-like signal output (HDOD) protein
MAASSPDTPTPARPNAPRWFGRFQLTRLLGKSERTMAWLVHDPRKGRPLMIVLPRVQPVDAQALENWQLATRQAARLDHPNLAAIVESGVQDGWPWVAHDPGAAQTLADRIPGTGMAGSEVAALGVQLLQGLAFAHEAGLVHHDVQPYLLLLPDGGQSQLAGLAVAAAAPSGAPYVSPSEATMRRTQRAAAEHDVLAVGVLMHGLLVGQPALADADIARVVRRVPPIGRDVVRLPWTLSQPLAEPLRAIVNRATDRQERQRYRNARTLLRALEGWLQVDADASGGLLALLSDRLHSAGVLPALPGGASRAARLALMERERTNELADVVLEDLALSFELLRLVNSAHVRGSQVSGAGPVLTVRRSIAMLGLDGVRRAALALREWPGPLDPAAATELQRLIDRCKRAGRLALILRPAGYDGEVAYLITLMQNLGLLVVHYHFPEEALQVHRLMQPAPPPREGEPEEPGMSEESAAFAVLGVDIETIGVAVARHWGLDDAVVHMIRHHPLGTPVRSVETDDDMLRTVASCANEAVRAAALPGARAAQALQRVVQRYARVLNLSLHDLQAALLGQVPGQSSPTRPAPLDEEPVRPRTAAGREDAAERHAGAAR